MRPYHMCHLVEPLRLCFWPIRGEVFRPDRQDKIIGFCVLSRIWLGRKEWSKWRKQTHWKNQIASPSILHHSVLFEFFPAYCECLHAPIQCDHSQFTSLSIELLLKCISTACPVAGLACASKRSSVNGEFGDYANSDAQWAWDAREYYMETWLKACEPMWPHIQTLRARDRINDMQAVWMRLSEGYVFMGWLEAFNAYENEPMTHTHIV